MVPCTPMDHTRAGRAHPFEDKNTEVTCQGIPVSGGAGRGGLLETQPHLLRHGPSAAPMTVNAQVSHYKGINCRRLSVPTSAVTELLEVLS